MKTWRNLFRKFVCVLVSMSLMDAPVSAATPKTYDRGTDDDSRLALVIGNSAYLADPLDNPVNDANAVAKALDRLGFEVMLAKDKSGKDLRQFIRQFLERARNERGTALVYYAGHAVAPGGRNILLPVDINPKSILEVDDEGVHVERMLRLLETSRKHTRIMIFDACRHNPYGQSGERLISTLHRPRGIAGDAIGGQKLTDIGGGLAEVSAQNTVIAFSTAPGAVAEDGEGTNSLFTTYLVEALSVPGLTVSDVFRRVTERVKVETRGAQVPWITGKLERPFTFNPASAATPTLLTVAPPTQELTPTVGEQRRASIEAQLATEMAKIKQFQRAEKVGIEKVASAQAERERAAKDRAAVEKTLADLAEARRKAEAEAAAKQAEEQRVAFREAAERKARDEEAKRVADERASIARATAQRAEQLERERQAEAAAKAREAALAESKRLEAIEQARLRQLAAERAQTEERERMANLALQKQRERDAGERTRAEVARLALLAELAKPVAMLGSGLDQKWLRQDAKGDLLVRGVKLPFDVRINPPTDDVPSACRGYSGAWGRARWDGERSAEIWIESVTADCRIKAVYGRGGDSVDGDDPTFVRAEGSFEGGKVQLRVSPTASVTIAPDGDGGLAATWQSNSKRVSLTFQRISSDPKANAEYVSLEEMDYGTRPTGSIWSTNFSRALPMEVPGVRTLSTAQLWQMLSETKDLQLVSAHEGQSRPLIERSVWLPDLGKPMSYRAVNGATVRIGAKELDDLRTSLAQLTGGDKTKPIVVYDRSVTWGWFGYHGAIRLREMGYANVYWFRGGTDAWHDAGLPLRKTGS